MVLVVNLGRVVFAPLVEPLQRTLEVDAAAVGLLASLVWLGSAVPRIPTGYLLTKVPRHYVVLGTGVTLAGATGLASFAPGIGALQAAALLMGVTGGAYFIAANPLVSELFPSRVGLALGVHGMAAQTAAVGAPLFVTWALGVGTWRTVFRVMAVAVLVATAAFTVLAWRTDLPEAGTEDRDMFGAVRHQWRIVVAGIALLGVAGFVWQGVFNFYVSYLVEAKDLAGPTANRLLSVLFAAGLPAFGLSGQLADRLPVVPYTLALLGGFVAVLFVLTATNGLLALVAVTVALGYVVHSLFPAVDTYLLGSLPDRHRASAYAAYSGLVLLVQAGGSWAVGSLRDGGVPFTVVFGGAATALAVVFLALATGYVAGLFPTGARE